MSKLTSRERRGSIVLISIGCLLIFAMTLIKGLAKKEYAGMPAVETSQTSADTIIHRVSAKQKSDTTAKSHRRKSSRASRPKLPEGRQRDYLSEPVQRGRE